MLLLHLFLNLVNFHDCNLDLRIKINNAKLKCNSKFTLCGRRNLHGDERTTSWNAIIEISDVKAYHVVVVLFIESNILKTTCSVIIELESYDREV